MASGRGNFDIVPAIGRVPGKRSIPVDGRDDNKIGQDAVAAEPRRLLVLYRAPPFPAAATNSVVLI